MKKSFILYHDLCEILDDLTDEQAGQLFKEICNYSKNKTQNNPEKPTGLNGLLKAVFNPFKSHIDRDFEAYQKKCKINAENGKYGGRPAKNKTQNNPEKPDKDNDNEKDKDKDKENEKGNDKGKYKWKGKIIKLSEKDYLAWKTAYKNINIDSELQSLDDFYFQNDVKNWFTRCSQALNKKNINTKPKPERGGTDITQLTQEEKDARYGL